MGPTFDVLRVGRVAPLQAACVRAHPCEDDAAGVSVTGDPTPAAPADVILRALGTDHHRLCASRDREPCDCYARHNAEARAALASLLAEAEELRESLAKASSERDEARADEQIEAGVANEFRNSAEIFRERALRAERELINTRTLLLAAQAADDANHERAVAAERLCATQKEALEAAPTVWIDDGDLWGKYSYWRDVICEAALRLGEPE
jgi:hypothetical protein